MRKPTLPSVLASLALTAALVTGFTGPALAASAAVHDDDPGATSASPSAPADPSPAPSSDPSSGPSSSASPSPEPSTAPSEPATPPVTAPSPAPTKTATRESPWQSYHVSTGVLFNSASGSDRAKYAINNRLLAVIDHARYKSWIRIMSWNVMSRAATDHLLAAQRRGVYVRVLMDSGNSSADVPNPEWRRLVAGLSAGNHRSYHYGNSGARVCYGSCRGTGGQAHSKYYLFSHSGDAEDVVMEGSANFTVAAATNQWNDLFTFVGGTGLYDFAGHVFEQMWFDTPVYWAGGPWAEYVGGSYSLNFSPTSGSNFHGYPTTNLLANKTIRCAFYTPTGSIRRTIIRLFPDVMRNSRGARDAYLIKGLWDRGCDVRVAYTVLSVEAHNILTRGGPHGPVPLRHVATDPNHDGVFDKYFHLKVLTFNGKVNDQVTYKLIQGSSNLSGASSASDENIGIFTTLGLVMTYQHWLDYWFAHAPAGAPYQGSGGGGGARELLALRSPTTGKRAATSDGYIPPGILVVSPKTGAIVDPYAHIDDD